MSEEAGQLFRSPEQVELFLPIAGPTTRMLAFAIDFALMILIQIAIWIGLLVGIPWLTNDVLGDLARWVGSPDDSGSRSSAFMLFLAAVFVLQFAVELGYFVFCEWATDGQSVGKRRLRIRVVQDGGFPMRRRQSLVRNLMRIVDTLPTSYLVGLVSMIVSREGKRLGDFAAGTVVVRLDRPPAALPVPAMPDGARASFLLDRAQIARIGPNEVTLALETLRRLDTLDPDDAARALERAATVLQNRLGHPPIEPHERAAFLHAVLAAVGL